MTEGITEDFHRALKAKSLSVSGISQYAAILARVVGEWFVRYGQQQKDDRQSANRRLESLERRLKRLEKDEA